MRNPARENSARRSGASLHDIQGSAPQKRVLITGVGGFVGTQFASYLAAKNFSVYGFDRTGTKIDGVVTYCADILDDKRIKEVVLEARPNYVVHLAAQSSVKKSWEQPDETYRVNVTGTRNLLDALLLLDESPLAEPLRVMIVSSAEIYGIPQFVPIPETHPLRPHNPYAKSRLAQEKLIEEFLSLEESRGIDIAIARSFPHTGPGQDNIFVCSDFAYQIARIEKGLQKNVIEVGNLAVARDFTDVRDILDAYHILLTSPSLTGAYNICSGKAYQIEHVLDMLCALSAQKIEVHKNPDKIRPVEMPVMLGDPSKFFAATSWAPKIPFEKTMSDLLAYWRERV